MKKKTSLSPAKRRVSLPANDFVPAQPAPLERYPSVQNMVSILRPTEPVHCLRPDVIADAARWFIKEFPGEVMYSVKSNPDENVLRYLRGAGLRHFDVASLAEVMLVDRLFPGASMYFMHPVKNREAIFKAYYHYGIRAFSLDSVAELEKILEVTNQARDLELYVRLAINNEHAAIALTSKFGVAMDEAPELLRRTRAVAQTLGVCFHVGSQCMNPSSYRDAVSRVRALVDEAQVTLDVLDVGGGFPSIYPDMAPPPLSDYMGEIKKSLAEFGFAQTKLFCEPGRALVAEGGSVVARVELRKGNALYLNDGTYGSLFDAGFPGFTYPVRAYRPEGVLEGELMAFAFFGPTCDSMDAMKGPFMLPADINEGDWIEIGQMGAYGATMRTKFNGFFSDRTVEVDDQPILSML